MVTTGVTLRKGSIRSRVPAKTFLGLKVTRTPCGSPVPAYGTINLVDPQHFNEARWSVKFDHNFSAKDTINGEYLFQDGTYDEAYQCGNNFVGPACIQDGRGQSVGLTWNHTFSPSLLNTVRLGYLRHRLDFPAPAGTLGVPGFYTIDGMGADFGQYAGLPQYFTENQFQYMDTMSLVKGKHNFKFGGEYRRTRNGSRFFNDTYGTFYPWSIEDLMTDLNFTNDVEAFLNPGKPHAYGGAYLASAAVVPPQGRFRIPTVATVRTSSRGLFRTIGA